MSFVIAGILGMQIGLLVLIAYPVAIAPGMDAAHRKRVSDIYYHMAMFAFGRAMIGRRTNGGVSLVKSTFSGKRSGEKVTLDGDVGYFEDTHNFMRTFKNKPFGLFYEGVNCILDPSIAEIAAAKKSMVRQDEHVIEDARFTNDENGAGKLFTPYVRLPSGPKLVDMAAGADMIHGSMEPQASETAYVFTVKSQELFNRFDQLKQAMMMLMAFGTGYGVVWFGISNSGTAESVGDSFGGGLVGMIGVDPGTVLQVGDVLASGVPAVVGVL